VIKKVLDKNATGKSWMSIGSNCFKRKAIKETLFDESYHPYCL